MGDHGGRRATAEQNWKCQCRRRQARQSRF